MKVLNFRLLGSLILVCLFSFCHTVQFIETHPLSFEDTNDYIFRKLILYPDNTFEYRFVSDLLDVKSKGNWERDNNHLILNSFDVYKSGYIIKVEEYNDETIDGYSIKVLDDSLTPQYLTSISFDNCWDEGFFLNEEGEGKWKKKINSRIQINNLGDKYIYDIQNSEANVFVIYIKRKDISIRYFANEHWKIRNKKVLIDESGHHYKLNGQR